MIINAHAHSIISNTIAVARNTFGGIVFESEQLAITLANAGYTTLASEVEQSLIVAANNCLGKGLADQRRTFINSCKALAQQQNYAVVDIDALHAEALAMDAEFNFERISREINMGA